MVGVGCLVKNTQLVQDLKDMVEYISYDLIARNKEAGIGSVYNIIRKSGIEIDLQSVGHIYNEVLDKGYRQIMSDQQVNDFILKNYTDAIRRAALLEPKEKEKQVGEDKPEMYVVNGILNMFYNTEVADESTQSDMLKMQNALWKGVQRQLKLPESQKPQNKEQWNDILSRALGYEQLGITDVNGQLNSISDLYNEVRDQLTAAVSKVKQDADPAAFERLQEMVNQLQASSYSLLFSKKEARQVLDDMMKDAGFGKQLKDGRVILDWNKLAGDIGSIQDIRANIESVLTQRGYSTGVIEGVKDSLVNEFNELQTRILEKADKELAKRQKGLERESSNKSDLRRLAELNNLGIFESSYDKVLYDLLGVNDLTKQDIADLKQLSVAASNLYRHVDANFGSEVFASRAFQDIQRSINNIVTRNINNKTRLLKIINGVNNFLNVYLTGLLAAPLTIAENLYSGLKEILAPVFTGASLNKEDRQIYWKMLGDVTRRGQSFGEEIGSFAPRELYLNTLKWKWKGGTLKEKAESALFAITIPARVGLLGFDSANKVTVTNKTFKNAIYQALTQQGMSKEDATKFMNEALYGKSWEQAKKDAKDLIERMNKDLPDKNKMPVNNRTIVTLANDLVKHNLNTNGALNNDIIEAAYKSSYHVAGYGLGHEPNNWLSRTIKEGRNNLGKRETELIAQKKWDKVAMQKLKASLVNNFVVKFTGGATNWLYLRAQQNLGVGFATGFLGDWKKDIDFSDKKTIEQSIKDIQNARNQIGRAMAGTSATLLAYMVGYMLHGGDDDDDKKQNELKKLKAEREEVSKKDYRKFSGKAEEKQKSLDDIDVKIKNIELSLSVMKRIKSDWMTSRLFKKTMPDAMLLHYYIGTEDSKLVAVTKYITNTYGLGDQFSTSSKISEASALAFKGNDDAANGQLGSVVGSQLGVPLWRAGKEWINLGRWIAGQEVTSDFKKPATFWDGVWGGGALQDMGVYKSNPPITILPGIGAAGYEKYKEHGISNMEELLKTKDWWDMKYRDENGKEKSILSPMDKVKAKQAAEKYKTENQ